MSWKLSRFRAGDWVEVLSAEEILATLDDQGCVESLPFMPEMLAFCGKRFRVAAVAHKTCETAHKTWKGRRIEQCVHLEGSRCDGSAHGGCQADCNLFWKDAWLKPVDGVVEAPRKAHPRAPASEAELRTLSVLPERDAKGGPRYTCQATKLFDATEPLAWWNPRQYLRDILTRNHSAGYVLRTLFLQNLGYVALHTPVGWRIINGLRDWLHQRWLGRGVPDVNGGIPDGEKTPTVSLGLKAGDWVRVKTKEEILRTIDRRQLNRGLSFDVEMTPYCGKVFQVKQIVRQILDEVTGEMVPMKNPCIVLDGVVCGSHYSPCRLMCPRAIPPYWREIWLEPVEAPKQEHDQPQLVAIESLLA